MPEPFLMFPVVCPQCRNEESAALPVAVVAGALLAGNPVRLSVSCHNIDWTANVEEVERLRIALANMPTQADKSSTSTSVRAQNPGIRRAKPRSQLTTPR